MKKQYFTTYYSILINKRINEILDILPKLYNETLNKEIIELHSKIKNIYIFTKQYIETSELIKELEILNLIYESIYLTKNIYYKNDNKNKKIRILKEDLKYYCNDLKNDLLSMFKLVNESN